MMTCGDIMAQKIEKYHMEKEVFALDGHDKEQEQIREAAPLNRRTSLRRYMTKPPPIVIEEEPEGAMERIRQKMFLYYPMGNEKDIGQIMADKALYTMQYVHTEIEDVDWVRVTSMGVWAAVFWTPGMMVLYKVLDRLGLGYTPFAVACRVAATVVYSVPNNAAFFAYGTCIHHTVEWYDERSKLLELQDQAGGSFNDVELPEFDVAGMLDTVKLKIEEELWTTCVNSFKLWVPIHAVNFTVVPALIRPLTLNFFNIWWNCYLSLVQHRDICVEEVEDTGTKVVKIQSGLKNLISKD